MIKLKSAEDIKKIRESALVLSETFQVLASHINEGISTLELDKIAHDYIMKNGGTPAFLGYMDYPASICASVNNIVIHGIPNSIKLKNGDILSLDLGVNLNGYISDAAYTYAIGDISPEVSRLLKVTKECLDLAIEQAKVGNRIQHLSNAVYTHAKQNGFGVVHQFCGHGVGFSLHEDPQVPNYISNGPNPRLKPGMVLAIEPMINAGSDDVRILEDDWTVTTVDNSLSAHFEHTIVVLEDSTETLTAFN